MKLIPIFLIGGLSVARLLAFDNAEVAAVAKRFDNPVTDEQYQARMELNRLVAQATQPGKGDPAAVTKVLVAVLQSQDTSVEAAKYLLRSLARVGTFDAAEPLAKILAGDNAMLREEARAALSWIRDPKATALLESALTKSTDKREQRGLIAALASQKSATSVPLLAPFVLDADPDLSRDAVDALARIGGAPAITTLTSAHASDKLAKALKSEVENALLAAGSDDLKTVIGIYQSTTSATIKLAAFIALMKNAPESAKPVLIKSALKSEDSGLRHAALSRGLEIKLLSLQSSLASSIGQMPKDDRLIVLANLHHLKPAETAEKIAFSCAASTEEDERIAAINALGKIGTKGAFDALLQAVGAKEPRVNQAADNALASTTYPAAANSFLAVLKGDSSPDKILAIKALNSVQVPDAGEILIGIIKGPDQTASKEAMKMLYFIASLEDLRVLSVAAATATDPELRKDLISICSRIATRFNTPEASNLVKDLK
jgi:HEAT repeat protein